MKRLRDVVRDSRGQDLIEYGLLISVISCGAISLVLVLTRTSDSMRPVDSIPDDPVALFVRDRMQPASGALFVPSPLQRERASEAVLEIAPYDIDPKLLELQLQARAREAGVTESDSLQIAPRMVASLVADRIATITPKDQLDRAIRFGERTTWRWNVTPKAGSTLTLTATLTAPVIVEGKETGYQVKSFEKTVTVDVTSAQRVTDILAWVNTNKWPLGLGGTSVAMFVAWMRRRSAARTSAQKVTGSSPHEASTHSDQPTE